MCSCNSESCQEDDEPGHVVEGIIASSAGCTDDTEFCVERGSGVMATIVTAFHCPCWTCLSSG